MLAPNRREERLMLGVSVARHFRRLGFCLIAAPAVLLIGALLHPQSKDDTAAHLAVRQ